MSRSHEFRSKVKRRTILSFETLEDRTVPTASAITVFNNGSLVVKADLDAGVQEAPVPLSFNNVAQGNFQVVDIYHEVQGTNSLTLDAVDTISNSMVQLAYQNADGSSSGFGTAIGGNDALQTAGAYHYVLTITQANVTIDANGIVTVSLQANIGTAGTETITHTYYVPTVGLTTMDIGLQIKPSQNVTPGNSSQLSLDALPGLTLSSMYEGSTSYNADVLKYIDATGNVVSFPLSGATPNQDLFTSPQSTETTGFLNQSEFGLFNDPGSTWQPGSPSIAVQNLRAYQFEFGSGIFLPLQADPIAADPAYVIFDSPIDLQRFLAAATDPSADNLTVWSQVGQGDSLGYFQGVDYGQGTELAVSASVSASPPGQLSAVTAAPVIQPVATTLAESPPQIDWNAVSGAASYQISLVDITTGQAVAGVANSLTTEWLLGSNLTGDLYQFKVRGLDGFGEAGPWNDPVQFTPPSSSLFSNMAPVPIGPSGSISFGLPPFTWNGLAGADHYDLWVDDVTANVAQVYRNQNISGTSFQPGTDFPSAADQYRWWVRGINAQGQDSAWSAPTLYAFDPGSAPAPLGPTGNVVFEIPTFYWSSVTGADHYDLWINDVTSGAAPNYRNQNVLGTSFQPGPGFSVDGHQYTWWVRAVDASGNAGPWSAGSDYTFSEEGSQPGNPGAPPADLGAPPNPIAPINASNGLPAYSWTAVSGAAHYDLWIDDVTSGASPSYRDANVDGTSFQPGPGFSNEGDQYQWWVRAVDASGQAGSWSIASEFTYYPLPAPTNPVDMSSGLLDSTPTLTWSAVPGAAGYDVWVDDQTTGTSQVVRDTKVTATTFQPGISLAPGQSYTFWVRAMNGAGPASGWSAPLDFTVAGMPPTPQRPTGTVIGAVPTFNWAQVSGADHYDLWVDDLTSGQSQVIRLQDVNGTSMTPAALTVGHSYRWWVRAVDTNMVPGLWSVATDFSYYTLAAPSLVGPVGSTMTSKPTFSWNPVSAAGSYDLWVDDLTLGRPRVLRDQGVMGTSFTPALSMSMEHSYRFWVRALDANGVPGAWSAPLDFNLTTQLAPVGVNPHLIPGAGLVIGTLQPTITWFPVAGADHYELWIDNQTTGQSGVVRIGDIAGTSITLPTPLIDDNLYMLWVRPVNDLGQAGLWSFPYGFLVNPEYPN